MRSTEAAVADIARPALAEVLAVLTGGHVARYSDVESVQAHGPITRPGNGVWSWTHASPVEAVEALATARLWPWEPGDDPTRWWCDRCGGAGRVNLRSYDGSGDHGSYVMSPDANGELRCDAFDVSGARPCGDPPSHAALVAVASLGAPQLARYVHLAGEIARAAGCAGASVVWRPMTREAIEEMRKAVSWGVAPSTIVEASIQSDWYASDPRVASSAWGGWRPGVVSPEINEVMPMLRDLHAGGVRLVGLDASRIVLAVEAIGGDRG